jgi:hypothetical protein
MEEHFFGLDETFLGLILTETSCCEDAMALLCCAKTLNG